MPIVWLSVTNGIPKPIDVMPGEGPFPFLTRNADFASPVEVTVDADGDEIESRAQVHVSDALADALARSLKRDDMTEAIYQQFHKATQALTSHSRSLLKLFRQESRDLDLLDANEMTGKMNGTRWSADGTNWSPTTLGRYSVAISSRPVGQLSQSFSSRIQRLLDAGEEPLLAFDHLAEAQRSNGLRFKWVEATVAAELAIKEVLARIEPKLTTLLLEVPSPPIHKLYGDVLEAAAGTPSPYVHQLKLGAERRNRIIHKIEPIQFGLQETIDYIQIVTEAIDHLLTLSRAGHKGQDHDGPGGA